MALALPKLDNRSFDELVREGQRILPRRAPAWTDHNVHDPGITLIELFSWWVEQDIYRLDRLPDASVRAFLGLVGITPQPPLVASTVVELTPRPSAGALDLPAGLALCDASRSITFETTTPVQVSTARLVAVASIADSVRIDHYGDDTVARTPYLPFGANPTINHCLLLGFDAPLGLGGETITLYFWTDHAEADTETRRRLILEQAREQAAAAACSPGAVGDSLEWRLHYSVQTIWEYFTSAGTWAALEGVDDETRGLSLSGFVRVRVPADHAPGGSSANSWVVRCRLVSGHYECPPVIERIGINAVVAQHSALTQPIELGTSRGHANEVFNLEPGPVVAGSAQLHVLQDGIADDDWVEVAEWDRVGAHDRAFRLDPQRAQISFGDGRIGRVPPTGATLRCRYRVGGGVAGNIAARTLTHAISPSVTPHQPVRGWGGAPAETLDDARGRALAFLAETHRAIVLTDFETLALSTPGVPVARAYALAGFHPDLPCVSASGSVTVVVVPSCPADRPVPRPDFLVAVYRWLAPRCALTTELHVVPPSYRAVGVQARLHAESAIEVDALATAAVSALNYFLHPLTGGPDGTGWPVGRAVYRSEVMAILNSIAGVAFVDQLSLRAESETSASCANVTLCPTELVAAGEHHIQVIARRQVR
jgi:predicted phage baseplate assembly protein